MLKPETAKRNDQTVTTVMTKKKKDVSHSVKVVINLFFLKVEALKYHPKVRMLATSLTKIKSGDV